MFPIVPNVGRSRPVYPNVNCETPTGRSHTTSHSARILGEFRALPHEGSR